MKLFEKVIIIAAVAAGLIAIGLVLTFTLAPAAKLQERALAPYRAPQEAQGLVTYVSGRVFLYRGAQWRAVEIGELVTADDYLKTFENSVCDVQIGQRAVFSVLENTAVKLGAVFHSADGLKSETELLFGVLLCKVQKLAGTDVVRVRAGSAAFGIRGTEFLIERRAAAVVCAVKDGRVAVLAAEGGALLATVPAGRELLVDQATGRAGVPVSLSVPRLGLIDKLAEVDWVDTTAEREADLVKVAVEVEPDTAEIFVNGKRAGLGSYAGIYPAGTSIPVALKKNGYRDEAFTLTAKRGDNRTYLFKLDLDAPEKNPSAPEANEADELRIKRLEDDAKKAAADNQALQASIETLKANVETLQKQKAELQAKVDDANRKIKDALDKLK